MDKFDPKVEFSRLISLIKEFRWQEQSWQVKSGIIFGGCAVFLTLRRIYMAIEAKIYKHPAQLYGLPVVGSLITMAIWKNTFRREVIPKYGDIVMYRIGSYKTYVINDVQLLNAVYNKAVNRLSAEATFWKSYDVQVPVASANNDRDWSRRRKTAMLSITKVMNKDELADRISLILQEITYKELNSLLVSNNDGDNNEHAIWYPRKFLRNAVFNVIYFASFGKSSTIDDDLYKEYNKCITNFFLYGLDAFLALQMGTTVAGIFGFAESEKKFSSAVKRLYQMVEIDFKQVIGGDGEEKEKEKEREKDVGINNEESANTIAQCMYETYLMDSKNGIIDKETFDRCVADIGMLLFAGMDTTSHSTEVGVILLAKYPQIQEKIYKELSTVFESGKESDDNNDSVNRFKFTFSKIYECVFLRAFVNEVLRIACGSPGGVPRTGTKHLRCIKWTTNNGETFDVICEEVDDGDDDGDGDDDNKKYDFDKIINNSKNKIIYDYIIEPSAPIESNLAYLCLSNKKAWNKESDPMDLNLNYWLKTNVNSGKITFKNNVNSVPFSVGRNRDCLGQSLARKELLAFLANLILNYKIEAQNGDASSVNLKYKESGTYTVDPEIPVRISKR